MCGDGANDCEVRVILSSAGSLQWNDVHIYLVLMSVDPVTM